MIKLSNRLKAAASLVHKGSRLADVGCDHGYVPVYLVQQNIIQSAVASDVNEGPLGSCISLVNECGLQNKIKCIISDGLNSIDKNDIDDILIAGMGGELIADILEKCSYAKQKHLILNPMTHAEITREWLYDNGFSINNDIIVKDGRHYYSVFDAEYKADFSPKTRADYFLGNIKDFSNKEYFEHLLKFLQNKQKGGESFADVINAIKEKCEL